MDKETELYEKLLKIKGLALSLKSDTDGKSIEIRGASLPLNKYQLEEIIIAVNAAKAELKLLPHGTIQIWFKRKGN